MQHAIDIPAPAGADSETVITALETAALFRSKGDGREAMRWLRRAAESAGEAGDDERALSLSRVIADLHDELEQTPIPSSAPHPPPPSSRSAQPGSSSYRASHPPPPSARVSRPSLSSTRASTPPRPSARPSYSRPPSVRPTPEATASSPTPAPAASAPEPARVVTLPSVPAVAPSPSSSPTVTVLHTKGARHAARVAIEISTTKPGVFEARLLADGEPPRIGSTEALLVLLDPASHLLDR
jgi:hypothetical protein